MLMVPPLMKLAPVIGAVDIPDHRKVHKNAVPRIGGIAMIVGAIVPVVFWLPLDVEIISLLLAFSILLFFGVWDDRRDLHYRIKFIGQMLAVLIVVFGGDVVVYHVPFVEDALPAYIAIPFTIFALVGITNAINLSDGLDGLAGGTMLLTFSMIAFLAYKSGSVNVVLICLSVIGAILGFLRHNTYPARIFMGDTGSQFLGFSAGILVIVLSQQANQALSPVVPLILLGLPILDTFAVMAQRVYEKRSPFSPDKNHIHHKLLDIGFDHYEAVFIIYLVQTALVLIAYFMRYESDLLIFLIYVGFSVLVLYGFSFAQNTGWKVNKASEKRSGLKKWVVWTREHRTLEKWPTNILKVGLAVFFVASVFMPDDIHKDMIVLSLILLVFLIISAVFRLQFLEKVVAYVVCALSVYFVESNIIKYSEYSEIINIYVVILAIAFAVKVRFSRDKSFQITPLDFLVILLVLVVPNLPEFSVNGIEIGVAAFKLIVLFYACEAVLNIISRPWDIFRLGLAGSVLITVVRGLT
jgi:UDP-GlcNAc:undecaprenyl-phosphate GlcNAc-1-phosphate transferase